MQQEKFLIFLHANDLAHPSSFIVNENGESRLVSHRDEPDGLAQIAEDKEVIVIVPSCDVMHITVKLPKMNRSRLLKAIPFALEEHVLADIQDLHFALHDQQANEEDYPLSIVAQKKIEEWSRLLQSWNIKPDVFIPEALCLPLNDTTWHVAINDMAIVRTSWCHGFAVDKNHLFELLEIAMHANNKIPETVNIEHTAVSATSQTSSPCGSQVQTQYQIKQTQRNPEEILASLATGALNSRSLNLLQGRYANKKFNFPQMKKIWKWNAYLGISCLVLLFIYPIISNLILKQRIDSTNQQIEEIYKRNFPNSNNIIAPKTRMEEKLQKIITEKNESRLLNLLAEIARGRAKANNIKLKRYDFTNNQLTLDLSAQSSEDFSAFTDFLISRGLRVKQQNATLVGTSVDATLEIDTK